MSVTLTIDERRISTLKPDGTLIGAAVTDPNPYVLASIGEYKKLEIDILLGAAETFADTVIYFNPALFILDNYGKNDSNNAGYYYRVTSATATGTDYPMTFENSNSQQLNIQAKINFSAITPNPAATITLYYYQTADVASFIQSSLYTTILNENRLDNTGWPPRLLSLLGSTDYQNSRKKHYGVYKDGDSSLGIYISVTDTITGLIDTAEEWIPYEAKLFGVNFPAAAADITDGTFTLYNGSNTVTEIQLGADTKVQIEAKCATAITDVLVWLIRTDTANNGVSFLENYECSFAEIVTDAGTTTLNNYIKAPSAAPTFVAGTTYRASFHIDYTKIEKNQKYKLLAVWYDTVNDKMNSYLSSEYATGGVIGYDNTDGELNFVSSFTDYNGTYLGNYLACVPEERIKATVKIEYESPAKLFYARCGFLDTFINTNDLRDYLYQIEISTYWINGVEKHYYSKDIINKKVDKQFQLPNWITIDSVDFNKELNLNFNFRVGFADDIPNLESYVNNVKQGTPMVNMNWSNKTIYVEYKFYLRYQTQEVPDIVEVLTYKQKLDVGEYENFDETPELIQTNDKNFLCSDDTFCPEFTLQGTYDNDYRFIGTLELQHYPPQVTGTLIEFECDNFQSTSNIVVGGNTNTVNTILQLKNGASTTSTILTHATTNTQILLTLLG